MPVSVKADFRAKEYLDVLWRHLHKCAAGNAVSNETWELLAHIQETEKDHRMSKEMADSVDAVIQELVNLYTELKEERKGFLIDANTLSRNGRKRVRESADKIGRILRK